MWPGASRLPAAWRPRSTSRRASPGRWRATTIPFADGRADFGFVCAPTYRWMRERVTLLPALVPDDRRAAGRPVYFADVVVRADSNVQRFDDLRRRGWAYNDRNSKSGWFSMLERAGGDTRFFSALVHAGSHLQSLAAVRDGRVDAAAIDSGAVSHPAGHRAQRS